jgi:hypothetical protein
MCERGPALLPWRGRWTILVLLRKQCGGKQAHHCKRNDGHNRPLRQPGNAFAPRPIHFVVPVQ